MKPLHLPFLALLLLASCWREPETFDARSEGGGGGGHDTSEPGDTGQNPGDTGGHGQDTGGMDTGNPDTGGDHHIFDNPGDSSVLDGSEAGPGGQTEVDLGDESGDSNQEQQFYLVLVNTGQSALGYQLWYSESGAKGNSAPRPPLAAPSAPDRPPESAFRRRLRDWVAANGGPGLHHPSPPPPLAQSDIGHMVEEFHVRDDLGDDSSYATVSAKLWALGDSVAIWVDEDVPIDWDYDCDGVVDEPSQYDAYGFDNCDLQTIADIVDTNVMVNLESLFGEVSDLNGDERVTVLITPVLNRLPTTADDEDDWAAVVEAYADPEVDLNDFDSDMNPGSDEQEIIYVFAPDPYGYYNSLYSVTVEQYTSVTLAARIAQVLENLISYNQHVLVNGGDAEEQWLDLALGALAADLTGFGSIFWDDAWDYLDAPHLAPLVTESSTGSGGPEGATEVGAQYLFARWLVDTHGTDILQSLVQTSATGTDNVEQATGEDFDQLVLQWQVALLTTGVEDESGDPLVDAGTWPPYADPSFIEVDDPTHAPESPTPGIYYGANGYQTGIAIHGTNYVYEGGTTEHPEEDESSRVLLENTDSLTYVPGFSFYGYVEGGYAAQVVRLRDINYDEALLELQASSTDYVGAVVRWTDPETDDLAVENIFSATDANAVDLPPLPEVGETITGVGEISAPAITQVVTSTGTELRDVYDTDRWRLDLTDRPLGERVRVGIWIERHYRDSSGTIAPEDPWFAVVPEEWVPTPTVETVNRDACPAEGALDFAYPSSVLDYLYYQVFLADDPCPLSWIEDTGESAASSGDFDPCGTPATASDTGGDTALPASPGCAEDWDQDGVLDEDEPEPTTFLEQVQVRQCDLGVDPSEYVDEDVVDQDSVDEDDESSYDRSLNAGGRTGDVGEDGYGDYYLVGGNSYLVVVGGGGDQGVYELNVKRFD